MNWVCRLVLYSRKIWSTDASVLKSILIKLLDFRDKGEVLHIPLLPWAENPGTKSQSSFVFSQNSSQFLNPVKLGLQHSEGKEV